MTVMPHPSRVVIFGASGAIGCALCDWFLQRGWRVSAVSRTATNTASAPAEVELMQWDPFAVDCLEPEWGDRVFDAAIWAQGQNFNDSIHTFDAVAHEGMYRANVVYILQTLQLILSRGRLTTPSRLCIISSIWQNIARQNKLSYTVSKAALQGLVQSLMIDLGNDGHLINAVLPGALDTPMTRSNLLPDQIEKLERLTPVGRLSTLEDVCNLVGFLCSTENTGITGQFIAADRGFSHAHIL